MTKKRIPATERMIDVRQEIVDVLRKISVREHVHFVVVFRFEDGPERGESALVSNCEWTDELEMLRQAATARFNTMVERGLVELIESVELDDETSHRVQ
jgi:hypothetical protein